MEVRIEALERDVADIKVEVATIKATHVSSNHFNDMQRRLTRIEARLDQIEVELDQFGEQIELLKLKLQEMEHEIVGIRLAIAHLNEEIRKMRSGTGEMGNLVHRIDVHFYKFEACMKTWMLANALILMVMQAAVLGVVAFK